MAAAAVSSGLIRGGAIPENAQDPMQQLQLDAERGDPLAKLVLGLCYCFLEPEAKDETLAFQWIRNAAQQGYLPAQFCLGFFYKEGVGVSENQAEGMEWLRKAAEQGDLFSQFGLGECYKEGDGIEQNHEAAFLWLEKVAHYKATEIIQFYHRELEYVQSVFPNLDLQEIHQKIQKEVLAEAQYSLGLYYLNGTGVSKNEQKAIEWFQKAIQQGYPEAKEALISCYRFLYSFKAKDNKEKLKWLEKLADQGAADAQNVLGLRYLHGEWVEADPRQAFEWFQKAANQGNLEAQSNLGWCYLNGSGIEKDLEQAIVWLRKAAERGYAAAQYNLALCYEKRRGVPKDQKQAVEWYRKAAEQGYARAQYNLAVCYEKGRGVPKDQKRAIEWYRKAVEQKNIDAKINLGVCYAIGKGVKKDLKQAVEWFQEAANCGISSAQFNLALCYGKGNGVKRDKKIAAIWYRKAAEQGHVSAQFNLALCYKNGQGVPEDHNQAIEWYRKAADQGDPKAQYNLGTYQDRGKDRTRAVFWYRKAANQGDLDAQLRLSMLYAKGLGVHKDKEEAFRWIQKASEQLNGCGKCSLWCFFRVKKPKQPSVKPPRPMPTGLQMIPPSIPAASSPTSAQQVRSTPKSSEDDAKEPSMRSLREVVDENPEIPPLFQGIDTLSNFTGDTYEAQTELFLLHQQEQARLQENTKILMILKRSYLPGEVDAVFHKLRGDIAILLTKIRSQTLPNRIDKAARIGKVIAEMLPPGLSGGVHLFVHLTQYLGNLEYKKKLHAIARELGTYRDSDKIIEDFSVRALHHYFEKFHSYEEKAYASFGCVVIEALLIQLIRSSQNAFELKGAELYSKAETSIAHALENASTSFSGSSSRCIVS